jgi:hypothetical protein
MKKRAFPSATKSTRQSPRGAGTAASATRKTKTPAPGWKGHAVRTGWRNPRTPSVPATLDLTLDEYFAATSLMGLIASQSEEPNHRWCCDWSFKMGRTMAKEARKRRRASR